MWSNVGPTDFLLVSIRDYVQFAGEKPRATMPRAFLTPEGRRVSFQIWDWVGDDVYTLHLFILRDVDGRWETAHHETRSRMIRRDALSGVLREAGCSESRWHMPGDTGYDQPIVTARKG